MSEQDLIENIEKKLDNIQNTADNIHEMLESILNNTKQKTDITNDTR